MQAVGDATNSPMHDMLTTYASWWHAWVARTIVCAGVASIIAAVRLQQ